jgi:4-amino-4-deoxy-L-arabinose transferase-like glycosyltransferase
MQCETAFGYARSMLGANHSRSQRRDGTAWYALLATLVLLALAFQGSRGLYDPDEGRYVNVAINMLDSGDYLVSRLDAGHPHYTKPPLTYWLLAASMATFGRNEWAARLPNALAFVGTGLALAWLGQLLALRRPLAPAWVWALMLLPFAAANIVTADFLLTLLLTLGIGAFCAARIAREQQSRARLWYCARWGLFGLAFPAKGPPALLPLIAATALTIRRDGISGLRSFAPIEGIALFVPFAFGWFALIVARDPQLSRYFLEYEVFDRLFTAEHHRNPHWQGVLAAFGPLIAIGTLPWSIVLLASGIFARRAGNSFSTAKADAPAPDIAKWWLAVSIVAFVIAQSRMPLYLLPLSAPFALWVAHRLETNAYTTAFSMRSSAVGAVVWIAVLVALKGFGAHVSVPQDARALAAQVARVPAASRATEWVFVDVPARFVLRLYTGREVERATLVAAPTVGAKPPPVHDICRELRESARPIFLTNTTQESVVRDILRTCSPSVRAKASVVDGYAMIDPYGG